MTASKHTSRYEPRGFTLIELLVVISIIAILMSILIPCLGKVKDQARAAACLSNLRQIGLGMNFYVNDHDSYFPPAYDYTSDTHWWGQKLPDRIDHTKGVLWPYLKSILRERGIYECPSQRFGTYNMQGKPPLEPDDPKWITSTYGYNGYYLCPPATAWSLIRDRPWQKITNVPSPAGVMAFADTLLDRDTTGEKPDVENNALLDPPWLYDGSDWQENEFPTTCFRHASKTNVLFADSHCDRMGLEEGSFTHPKSKVGSVGTTNSYYVPDHQSWLRPRRSARR